MTLIKSISGIRGTIGGPVGNTLSPLDVVKFTSAYAQWLIDTNSGNIRVVTGRDARLSGPMVHQLVNQTLIGMGIDVIDLELSTTPTVSLSVITEKANGGIVLTASHNPKQWNALKLLNENGEFINAQEGKKVLILAEETKFNYATVDQLGTLDPRPDAIEKHIESCLSLPLVNAAAIRAKKFKIVVDGVNSSGGIVIPQLLDALGAEVIKIHCTPNGDFPHNPEPLKEHLTDLCTTVVKEKADMGIAVDPDVDRLVFVDEKGVLFGEEYTLVACADYILSKTPGPTVSNLSSTRALLDVTKKYNQTYTASAVGEVNVVTEMKNTEAVIGGEGNGGVIYPESHYGRDALVGVVLFLSLLLERNCSVSTLKTSYPTYYMAKYKVNLEEGIAPESVLGQLEKKYKNEKISTLDGVKIDFEQSWVHLRKSNTEPILRIYTEAQSQKEANELAEQFTEEIKSLF